MYENNENRSFFEAPGPEAQAPAEECVPTQGKPPKKKRSAVKMVAIGLVCALAGGLVGGTGVAAVNAVRQLADRFSAVTTTTTQDTTIHKSDRETAAVGVPQVNGQTALTVDQVYSNNLASVVGVNGDVKTNYWGQEVSNPVAGSGFVVTESGYILTNYHVIDGVEDLKVSFADGTTYDATLVGGEEANDIAVLKIDAAGLRPVVVGSSENLRVGEQVVAIGNPLGELTFTLTAGYVSALDRNIKMEDGTSINVMQTDAAINSGNSGGPLFNIYGECVGITNAKYSNNGSTNASIEGIGFAIPIDDVIDMVSDIIEIGYVTGKPNLGIIMNVNDVSDEATRRYGIPQGAYIEAVLEGSCADKAGVKAGDIITGVDGTEVGSSEELKTAVKGYKAGDRVELTLYRGGETLTVTAQLDEYDQTREEEMDRLQEEFNKSQQESQQPNVQPDYDYGYGWPFGGFWW